MTAKEIAYLGPGEIETLEEVVKKRINEGDITSVVVASMKGKSALKIADVLGKSAKVVSITEFTYSNDITKKMKKLGVIPVEKADLPIQDDRGMKEGLLIFGSGVKAALEVASVAAGSELTEGKTIAIGGGKGGLDTALVVKAAPPSMIASSDPDERMSVLEVLTLPKKD